MAEDEDPWARFGLLAERNALPPGFDPLLFDVVAESLASVERLLAPPKYKIDFGITQSAGFRVTAFATGAESYICPVPLGLAGRLELLFQVLRREGDPEPVQVIDGDYYGDFPAFVKDKRSALRRPEPFESLGDANLRGGELWARLQELRGEFAPDSGGAADPGNAGSYSGVMLAVAFLALHEASHVVRDHALVIGHCGDAREGRRGAEVDADFIAAKLLAISRIKEVSGRGGEVRVRDLCAAARTATYAACGVLGLFDLDRLAVCDFVTDDYRHPSARMAVFGKGFCDGISAVVRGPAVAPVVEASADGARQYLARMNSFWRRYPETRRPTSIYVPVSLSPAPGQEREPIPFASALEPADAPVLRNVYGEAMKWLEQFNAVRDRLMNRRATSA